MSIAPSRINPEEVESVATWLKVLAQGDNAVVTSRDPASARAFEARYPDTVLALALDVTDQAQVARAVKATLERFGAIDVLVNNAGYGYRAAVEEGDEADVERLFGTNFFGPTSMIKEALPGMRERRSGSVINISSTGARIAPAGSG